MDIAEEISGQERNAREHRAETGVNQKQREHILQIQQAEGIGQDRDEDPQQFDEGRKQFVKQVVDIAARGDQGNMARHALEEADMPAFPLFQQIAEAIRRLGPADGVVGVFNGVGQMVGAVIGMELDDEFH